MMHCVTEHHIRRGCGLPLHSTQRFNEAVPNCMDRIIRESLHFVPYLTKENSTVAQSETSTPYSESPSLEYMLSQFIHPTSHTR